MFNCDVFLSSSNAITEQGQLVNVDGRSNREAMLTYGHKKVIIIIGKNKITINLELAFERIRKIGEMQKRLAPFECKLLILLALPRGLEPLFSP